MNILKITPNRVPTVGGNNITVTFSDNVPTSAKSANCQVNAAHGGTTMILNATTATFPATILSDTSVICHNFPRVVAPAPGVLVVTFDDVPKTTASINVEVFSAIDFAISKRPYIHEANGALLLRTDDLYFVAGEELIITARLPAAGLTAVWHWNVTVSSEQRNIVLPLSFSVLSSISGAIHNDLTVVVVRVRDHSQFQQSRRFHRVPPPPATSTVVPVQVDHATQGLQVDGQIWQGQGWYMSAKNGWPALIEQIKEQLIPMGVNVGMPYGLSSQPLAQQTEFLDACANVGFKVMYPLGTGAVKINHGGPFDQPAMLKELISNVTFVRHHPAILGYYICDDCCSNRANISLQSQVYQLLKNLDPYHVTIGAVNCGNSWMFTDETPSFLAPASQDNVRTLPEAVQPKLQLSLDVIMQENYDYTLLQHAGFGDWKTGTGVGSDGYYRHGITFEPLMNCPGAFGTTRYPDAHMLLSSQFLGLITAGMHDGLTFILTNETLWEDAIQIGLFAKRTNIMIDALRAPFGSVVHPTVTFKGDGNIRARAWSVPSNKVGNSTFSCTGYVVVVNVNETQTVPFNLKLSEISVNATRMFDSMGFISVGKDGVLSDLINAGGTNVYCLRAD